MMKKEIVSFLSQRKGLSILEVLIAIALSAAVVITITRFTETVKNIEVLISQKLQVQQDFSDVFDVFITDVRSMAPSNLGAYAIESASTSSFVFFSDVDRDGLNDRVRYTIGTSTMVKGVIKPVGNPLVYATSSEIVKNILVNVTGKENGFQYYDSNYTGTQASMTIPVDISQVRVIQFTVTGDVNASSSPKPTTFTDTITIRNLRTN